MSRWNQRGLWRDPGTNGGDAEQGMISVALPGRADSDTSESAVKSAFCADCHNQNANWSDPSDVRLNPLAHPIHVDRYMEVYGQVKEVAAVSASDCTSCHNSTYESAPGALSSFPHQSVGHKLLSDTYTTTSPVLEDTTNTYGGYTGDPYRPIPSMDSGVCRSCHTNVGQQDQASGF